MTDSLSQDLAQATAGEAAYKQEVAQFGQQEIDQGKQLVAQADQSGQQQVALAQQYADSQQPFDQPPPHDQINQVMAGAPWLFALMAFGGKASGMNGLTMMQGLNGMSSGIIKGDQAASDQAWNRYKAEFEKWQAKSEQQFRIYSVLADAYKGASDGKLRALDAAMRMTDDASSRQLTVDDPARMTEIRAKIMDAHAKLLAAQTKQQTQSGLTEDQSLLMAALTSKGVPMTGMRSGAQMKSALQGLLDGNPGKTPDEIAEKVKEGRLSMTAQTKEVAAAAGIRGKVQVAEGELERMAPIALQASMKVPRTGFIPITRLLQAGETSISDPNLKQLKIAITSLLNQYDVLAARGGTDKDKRAHAHALLTEADTPEALRAGIEQFLVEAHQADQGAKAAIDKMVKEGANGGGSKTVNFADLPVQ